MADYKPKSLDDLHSMYDTESKAKRAIEHGVSRVSDDPSKRSVDYTDRTPGVDVQGAGVSDISGTVDSFIRRLNEETTTKKPSVIGGTSPASRRRRDDTGAPKFGVQPLSSQRKPSQAERLSYAQQKVAAEEARIKADREARERAIAERRARERAVIGTQRADGEDIDSLLGEYTSVMAEEEKPRRRKQYTAPQPPSRPMKKRNTSPKAPVRDADVEIEELDISEQEEQFDPFGSLYERAVSDIPEIERHRSVPGASRQYDFDGVFSDTDIESLPYSVKQYIYSEKAKYERMAQDAQLEHDKQRAADFAALRAETDLLRAEQMKLRAEAQERDRRAEAERITFEEEQRRRREELQRAREEETRVRDEEIARLRADRDRLLFEQERARLAEEARVADEARKEEERKIAEEKERIRQLKEAARLREEAARAEEEKRIAEEKERTAEEDAWREMEAIQQQERARLAAEREAWQAEERERIRLELLAEAENQRSQQAREQERLAQEKAELERRTREFAEEQQRRQAQEEQARLERERQLEEERAHQQQEQAKREEELRRLKEERERLEAQRALEEEKLALDAQDSDADKEEPTPDSEDVSEDIADEISEEITDEIADEITEDAEEHIDAPKQKFSYEKGRFHGVRVFFRAVFTLVLVAILGVSAGLYSIVNLAKVNSGKESFVKDYYFFTSNSDIVGTNIKGGDLVLVKHDDVAADGEVIAYIENNTFGFSVKTGTTSDEAGNVSYLLSQGEIQKESLTGNVVKCVPTVGTYVSLVARFGLVPFYVSLALALVLLLIVVFGFKNRAKADAKYYARHPELLEGEDDFEEEPVEEEFSEEFTEETEEAEETEKISETAEEITEEVTEEIAPVAEEPKSRKKKRGKKAKKAQPVEAPKEEPEEAAADQPDEAEGEYDEIRSIISELTPVHIDDEEYDPEEYADKIDITAKFESGSAEFEDVYSSDVPVEPQQNPMQYEQNDDSSFFGSTETGIFGDFDEFEDEPEQSKKKSRKQKKAEKKAAKKSRKAPQAEEPQDDDDEEDIFGVF